jgi:hypothetical protein
VARIPKVQRRNRFSGVPWKVRTDFTRALWENPKTRVAAEANTPLRRIEVPEAIARCGVAAVARWRVNDLARRSLSMVP